MTSPQMLVPEIRFGGFSSAWEQRKLDEFVSFFSGLTYSPADIRPAGTLVLRSSNVKDGEVVDADNVYVIRNGVLIPFADLVKEVGANE